MIGSGLLAASNVTRQERVGFANWAGWKYPLSASK